MAGVVVAVVGLWHAVWWRGWQESRARLVNFVVADSCQQAQVHLSCNTWRRAAFCYGSS
jgi:hypothetical protein